ncbi:MAG: zf-HC2 domain-containing protein [Planctomycetota bacterium]
MPFSCQCPEWLVRLSAYHDDELTAPVRDAVSTHLAECAQCREELERLAGVSGRFASLRSARPTVPLRATLAAVSPTPRRPAAGWGVRLTALAVGALLWLAGGGLWSFVGESGAGRRQQVEGELRRVALAPWHPAVGASGSHGLLPELQLVGLLETRTNR